MSRTHLLISGAVALVCAGILVALTDVEVDVVRWLSCQTIARKAEHGTNLCR